jgi:6,7-dimethyl-8-ribityllumazine synthase
MTDLAPNRSGKGLRVGIVWSRFNEELVRQLLTACDRQLVELGVAAEDIHVVSVPGALEIPLALQSLAHERRRLTGPRYDALVALGCVVRGETFHFEIVAGESARGIMALTMDGMAIGNGILTVENEEQALVRADPAQKDKGGEAAKAALSLYELSNRFA